MIFSQRTDPVSLQRADRRSVNLVSTIILKYCKDNNLPAIIDGIRKTDLLACLKDIAIVRNMKIDEFLDVVVRSFSARYHILCFFF